jgi:hypothetical protein
MAERSYADLFEILIGRIRQDDKADVILGKTPSLLPETELLQSLRNLRRGPRPLACSPASEDLQAYPELRIVIFVK